ncbi:helix-turn-helix domain-containing protein [Saccharopolyspora sp. NPDC000359]|uniref:helix-turn-helix domain-containing protein n=1 Tax=Saccharopolyspora sp. NPDC000359 TaxID=3154251 RepID=UPI003326B630
MPELPREGRGRSRHRVHRAPSDRDGDAERVGHRLLSAGRAVTRVAAELAYDTPAAFSTMFRKQTGTAPSAFQPR